MTGNRHHRIEPSHSRGAFFALAALGAAALLTSSCLSINMPLFQKPQSALSNIVEAPDVAHYHFYLGREALRQGEPKTALKRFREALRHQPDFFEARVGAGHALIEMGRAAAARRDYERARALRDTPEVRLFLARALMNEGRLVDAATMAESAREGHPQPARVLETLGAIAYRGGRLGDAERLWSEALDIDQSNEALQTLLADLQRYLKTYPESANPN